MSETTDQAAQRAANLLGQCAPINHTATVMPHWVACSCGERWPVGQLLSEGDALSAFAAHRTLQERLESQAESRRWAERS